MHESTDREWRGPPATPLERPVADPPELSLCDREPVRFPAAIMPHGALLILRPGDGRILGASENLGTLLGVPAREVLDRTLDALFSEDTRQWLETGLARLEACRPARYLGCVSTAKSWERFEAYGHQTELHWMLEFEGLEEGVPAPELTGPLDELTRCMAGLRAANTQEEAMAAVARSLRNLTGFDTVIGNRFLADGSFQAVAEARGEVFPAFLDKRFPRSDIPEPGRQQMILMPVQYAPDLDYEPVPLRMAGGGPATGIDLGFGLLRSISRLCNRFYLNVGVRSRLVLSLLDHGQLWGFFSCWHGSPRRLGHDRRLACRLLVEAAAPALIEKARVEQAQRLVVVKRRAADIVAGLPEGGGVDLLTGLPERLLDSLDIGGAALIAEDMVMAAGSVPSREALLELRRWLEPRPPQVAVDDLAPPLPSVTRPGEALAGLLSMRLLEPGQYLLVFRPEWVHEVRWAGDPRKPVDIHRGQDGDEIRLSPRGSFEEWRQQVRGRSRPWDTSEVEAMTDLRAGLLLWLHDGRRQALLRQLERSNEELESFAYAVSHDLQEPLRGIHHFVRFLGDSAADRLEARERQWLDGLARLSQRMSSQIEALLQFSRATRESLHPVACDLGALLAEVLDSLSGRRAETDARIEVQGTLPRLICDPARVRIVFENLIANALKYNDKPEPRIEIGSLDTEPPVIFVRDNGIGIAPEHREVIFTIFRRLHGRDEFGGGTGAGLTLARRHVERHGGRLWLESTPGAGACFLFTLAPSAPDDGGNRG